MLNKKYRSNSKLLYPFWYSVGDSKSPTTEHKGVPMKFDEQGFRHLVDETTATIIRLGTTSHAVLDRYKRFTEMLVEHLKNLNQPFELTCCLEWVNSLEHDPAYVLSASYVDWKALHRFVHLLAEQQAGTLTEWRHYLCFAPELPETAEYRNILVGFQEIMKVEGKYANTVKSYSSKARRLLLYLESIGITKFSDVRNQNILDYLQTDRFKNRNLKGFQTELCVLKKFLRFAVDTGYTACETLPYALPKIRQSRTKIITTIDEKVESDLLEDEPDSLVNKRDQAVLLLALHTGLRSCDIRALRFCDIDWEKETIHIRQKKTGVDLEIPIDSATQNAIIDYILNERRDSEQECIFVTSVGPIKKLERRHYRMKYRVQGTGSYEKLAHDGLHIYRRTFASRLLQSGTPLPLISEMLGHIDKNTVRVYLSTDEAKMKRCALDISLIPCRREEY